MSKFLTPFETYLQIIYCTKCDIYYQEQTGTVQISCGVLHPPGSCCHYGCIEF